MPGPARSGYRRHENDWETCVHDLGPLVSAPAANDVRINPAAAVDEVLDDRFRRQSPDEPLTDAAATSGSTDWPKEAPWDVVAAVVVMTPSTGRPGSRRCTPSTWT